MRAKQSIEMRGTITHLDKVFEACADATPRECFRLLVDLAGEALHTRACIAMTQADDHPLRNSVHRMKPNEAMAFLLGVTRSSNTPAGHPVELDRPATTARAHVVALSKQELGATHLISTTSAAVESAPVDLNDDVLDMLTGHPAEAR